MHVSTVMSIAALHDPPVGTAAVFPHHLHTGTLGNTPIVPGAVPQGRDGYRQLSISFSRALHSLR
jgi:hypothetical protein